MFKVSFVFILLTVVHFTLNATFSIVAIDTETGEIGSAGASCIDDSGCGGCGGVIIISDIIPGVGACNAQASVCLPNFNLQVVMDELANGASPYDAWLEVFFNDACQFGDFNDRQYGIVAYDNGAVAAHGFTGDNNMEYAGNLTGEYYSIQGNILLGPEILEDIENAFLNTTGSLADRLMAALQGANVAGADSRCLEEGTSSQSAYLRVAQADDEMDDFYLDLNIPETPFGGEPIDALQSLYDEWLCEQAEAITSESTVAVCANELYEFEGNLYAIGTTNDFIYQAANGCDSTLSLTVEGLPIYSSTDTVGVFEGQSFVYEGMELSEGTTSEITFSASNGCDSTVFVTVEAFATGINAVTKSISIYPNPSSEYVNVAFNESLPFSYQIIDINGQMSKEGNNRFSNKIDLTELSTGVYFLKLYLEDGVLVEKIMKQ